MRVLGIDCGTERTGWGVVDSDGRDHRFVAAGLIETDPKLPLPARLRIIARELRQVIAEYGPALAGVEDVFYAANVRSALKLAHARGVALLALAEAGLDVGEYPPATVKSSVVGHGRAEKAQVQMMIRSLLRLETEIQLRAVKSEDAADALAVAICHAVHRVPQAVEEALP